MKKFLIISNSEYTSSLPRLPHADKSASELNRLILSKLYHGHSPIYRQNLTSKQIIKNISSLRKDGQNLEHLVIILIGHGVNIKPHIKPNTRAEGFAGVEYSEDGAGKATDFLPWRQLLDEMAKLKASQLTLILDCCHSESVCSLMGRVSSRFSTEKRLEVLTASTVKRKTYTASEYTWLSKSIIEVITSGAANLPASNMCTLESVFNSLQRRITREGVEKKITPLFVASQRSGVAPVFLACPDTIPKKYHKRVATLAHASPNEMDEAFQKIFDDLISEQDQEIRRALFQRIEDVLEAISVEKPSFSQLASSTLKKQGFQKEHGLPVYQRDWTYLTAPTFVQATGDNSSRKLNLQNCLLDTYDDDVAEITLAKHVRIYIHELGYLEAVRIRAFLSKLSFRMRDLPSPRIEIIDCDVSGRTRERYEQIFIEVIKSTHEIDAGWSTKKNSDTCLENATELFSYLSYKHGQRLEQAADKSDFQKIYRSIQESYIEPNFLVFRRGGEFSLVIIDSASSVDDSRLQKTNEAIVKAEPASEDEILELGFDAKNKVHPIFLDPANRIKNILFDCRIFALYLSQPNIKVKLPSYGYSDGRSEQFIPLSTFYRTIEQINSRARIQVLDLAKGRGTDRFQKMLISEHPCYSRFAPTPSGSLHLGNLRTAVLSYLASLPNSDNGHFELRFDDTNTKPDIARVNKERIRKDLAWVGLSEYDEFSQSDIKRQSLYSSAFDLLVSAGFVKDNGSFPSLDVDRLENTSGFLTDLKMGPRVTHNIKRTPGKKEQLSYSLKWPRTGLYQYKIAGILDDLMHSSVVVRDSRQFDSHFSFKQSIISESVRQAQHLAKAQGLKASLSRFESEVGAQRPKRTQPMPFFCPPVYIHVGRVCDENGKTLSKRLGNAGADCERMREAGMFYPETIMTWIISSMAKSFLCSVGLRGEIDVLDAVCASGPSSFLKRLRGKFDLLSLSDSRERIVFPSGALKRLDRKASERLGLDRLYHFLLSTEVGVQFGPTVSGKFAAAVWPELKYFAGASEVFMFFRNVTTRLPEGGVRSIVSECGDAKSFGNDMSEWEPQQMAKFRKIAFGSDVGPPVGVLQRCIIAYDKLGGEVGISKSKNSEQ